MGLPNGLIRQIGLISIAAPLALVAAGYAVADLKPDNVHTAEAKKSKVYVQDGIIVGGDKAINGVIVKDIRRATNSGFERVVIDLEGSKNGESAAVPRPPFYQVSVTPDENRLVFTLWGKPRLAFDAKKVVAGFKKSKAVQKVELFPQLEEDSWTFAFDFKGKHPIEVFELSNPVRIIVDIREAARAVKGK